MAIAKAVLQSSRRYRYWMAKAEEALTQALRRPQYQSMVDVLMRRAEQYEQNAHALVNIPFADDDMLMKPDPAFGPLRKYSQESR